MNSGIVGEDGIRRLNAVQERGKSAVPEGPGRLEFNFNSPFTEDLGFGRFCESQSMRELVLRPNAPGFEFEIGCNH